VSEEAGDATEVAQLRAQLRQLVAEAAENDRKLQRTLDRELELLRVETLHELFELLTGGLAASYSLEAVRLVLEDPHHEIQHLMLGSGHRPADYPSVRFVDTLVGLAPQFATLQRPRRHSRRRHEVPSARTLRRPWPSCTASTSITSASAISPAKRATSSAS